MSGKIKLFNLDLHISVIADVKNIFKKINSNIEITNWSISGHTWVFNKYPANVKHINGNTWKNINLKLIKKFQEEYDSFLKQFDGFIVTHTPVFCLLYQKYDKPIYLINSCRFEQPFSWVKNEFMFNYLRKNLKLMCDNGILIPICNNIADLKYLELGTSIKAKYIPSLCLYTNENYNSNKSKYITYDSNNIIPEGKNIISRDTALKKGYKWSELFSYKGIIHIPYEISTMSIFEQYSANIPMFFPSKTFLKELIKSNKIKFGSNYFKFKHPDYLDEALGKNWVDFWIDKADYYNNDMKYIQYFDDIDDLLVKLETIDTEDISNKMKEWNKIRQKNVYTKYTKLLEKMLEKNDDIFIYYNYYPKLAKHIIDIPLRAYKSAGVIPVHDYPTFEPLFVEEGDIIFVKTDLLDYFFGYYFNLIDNKFILLSGVSDIEVGEKYKKYVEHDKIIKWFGTNMTMKHPKTQILPIGFEEAERNGGNQKLLVSLFKNRKEFKNKENKICVTYLGNTHNSRNNIFEIFKDKKYVDFISKMEFKDYMNNIGDYKFVLSPRGYGIDTHRFWEILLMGSIPIVENSCLNDLFDKFPCIIVNNFSDITFDTINDFKLNKNKLLNVNNYLFIEKLKKKII